MVPILILKRGIPSRKALHLCRDRDQCIISPYLAFSPSDFIRSQNTPFPLPHPAIFPFPRHCAIDTFVWEPIHSQTLRFVSFEASLSLALGPTLKFLEAFVSGALSHWNSPASTHDENGIESSANSSRVHLSRYLTNSSDLNQTMLWPCEGKSGIPFPQRLSLLCPSLHAEKLINLTLPRCISRAKDNFCFNTFLIGDLHSEEIPLHRWSHGKSLSLEFAHH